MHLPIGGGPGVINATKEQHGPSWRMVVHMTDAIEAYGVYPGGQSGNPGNKYYYSFDLSRVPSLHNFVNGNEAFDCKC